MGTGGEPPGIGGVKIAVSGGALYENLSKLAPFLRVLETGGNPPIWRVGPLLHNQRPPFEM
eukprot:scaffold23868_cov219-Skeletonema_dohrnii-CCMP3373.AAC.2